MKIPKQTYRSKYDLPTPTQGMTPIKDTRSIQNLTLLTQDLIPTLDPAPTLESSHKQQPTQYLTPTPNLGLNIWIETGLEPDIPNWTRPIQDPTPTLNPKPEAQLPTRH